MGIQNINNENNDPNFILPPVQGSENNDPSILNQRDQGVLVFLSMIDQLKNGNLTVDNLIGTLQSKLSNLSIPLEIQELVIQIAQSWLKNVQEIAKETKKAALKHAIENETQLFKRTHDRISELKEDMTDVAYLNFILETISPETTGEYSHLAH